MISNCSHDENGRYSGGTAGDQTGQEWRLCEWYNRPWNVVLRYPDTNVSALIAELAVEAAKNDKIGYDQANRGTFWQQLKNVGYRPARITTACEADCSSGVAAIVKAAGYLKGIEAMKNVSSDMYTGNERSALKAAGFKALTASKYLTSDAYLLPGDVLLYENHHTAINVTKGSKAEGSYYNMSKVNTIPAAETKGTSVLLAQEILKARGFKGKDGRALDLDREYGPNTAYAITTYAEARNKNGCSFRTDGTIDAELWRDMLGGL